MLTSTPMYAGLNISCRITKRATSERLFTWDELAKRVYGVYTDFSDKEYKTAADLATANGWDKLPDAVAKITAAEDYIKKNVSYNERPQQRRRQPPWPPCCKIR